MAITPERYIDLSATWQKPAARYTNWERNVIDAYKSLPNEEIRARVEANRLPYAILMTHIALDYNLGAVLRIGNCLGAKVYYYGARKWDKRSACGVWNYSPITYLSSIEEVRRLKTTYNFVALEQTNKSVPLHQFDWSKCDKQPLIIVGEEAHGLQETPEIMELADYFVEIHQRGSVRSMNAATSVAIAAYDCCFKSDFFERTLC